jgi:hypothetical protein
MFRVLLLLSKVVYTIADFWNWLANQSCMLTTERRTSRQLEKMADDDFWRTHDVIALITAVALLGVVCLEDVTLASATGQRMCRSNI